MSFSSATRGGIPVSFVALAGPRRILRAALSILAERTSNVVNFVEFSLRIPPHVSLVPFARLDHFSLRRQSSSLKKLEKKKHLPCPRAC